MANPDPDPNPNQVRQLRQLAPYIPPISPLYLPCICPVSRLTRCDSCGKWRRLGPMAEGEQPERWECSLNPEVSPYISPLYLLYISLYLPISP